MRVLVAPDGFKGGPAADKVAEAMAQGVRRAGGQVDILPMADGGAGTADVLRTVYSEMVRVPTMSVDAYGRPRLSHYDRIHRTAIVEAAVGSGFVPADARPDQVLASTSLGTGLLMNAALADVQVQEVVVALGGTGSVDAGMGLLAGLGAHFYDAHGDRLDPIAGSVAAIAAIDMDGVLPLDKSLIGWCDVFVPLLGVTGAVQFFGPQKGVGPGTMDALERAFARYADRLEGVTGRSELVSVPGTGAAGGMGLALAALGGSLRLGAEQVAGFIALDQRIQGVDWVLTGEGRLDAQTKEGKVVATVVQHAQRLGVPTAVIAGSIDPDQWEWLSAMNAFAFSLVPGPMTLDAAVAGSESLLTASAFSVAGWAQSMGKSHRP